MSYIYLSIIIVLIIVLINLKTKKQTEIKTLTEELNKLKERFAPNIDVYNDYIETKDKLDKIKADYKEKYVIYKNLLKDIELFSDSIEMNNYNLYRPILNLETSERYKELLEQIYIKQKQMIKENKAIFCHTEWTVNGSKVEGRRQTKQNIKLMLKAFNGECNSIIAKVEWFNVEKSIERMEKSYSDLNKLGESNNIVISKSYLDLKLKELWATYEQKQKIQDEKEEQRRIREQIREEEKLQKEIEKKEKELEKQQKEEEKLQKLKQQAFEQGKQAEAEKYQKEIEKLNKIIEDNKRKISQAQLTKSGHVYIISNIGSFGENIYKIGMTRRLEPEERVNELGDASVPFKFDIHAMIHSDNAPELEFKLHEKFKAKSVNRINYRKEFFNVTLEEIENAVNEINPNANVNFTHLAEAREYRETLSILATENNLPKETNKKVFYPQEI